MPSVRRKSARGSTRAHCDQHPPTLLRLVSGHYQRSPTSASYAGAIPGVLRLAARAPEHERSGDAVGPGRGRGHPAFQHEPAFTDSSRTSFAFRALAYGSRQLSSRQYRTFSCHIPAMPRSWSWSFQARQPGPGAHSQSPRSRRARPRRRCRRAPASPDRPRNQRPTRRRANSRSTRDRALGSGSRSPLAAPQPRELGLHPPLHLRSRTPSSTTRVAALLQSPPHPLRDRRPSRQQAQQPAWTSQLAVANLETVGI